MYKPDFHQPHSYIVICQDFVALWTEGISSTATRIVGQIVNNTQYDMTCTTESVFYEKYRANGKGPALSGYFTDTGQEKQQITMVYALFLRHVYLVH